MRRGIPVYGEAFAIILAVSPKLATSSSSTSAQNVVKNEEAIEIAEDKGERRKKRKKS